mgnify:CR=1 FL=1
MVQHNTLRRERHYRAHDMFDEKDRHAVAPVNLAEQCHQLFALGGSHARHHLIEKKEFRSRGESAREFGPELVFGHLLGDAQPLDFARFENLDGDVVVYESEHGMSWVLVLVRAPGRQEDAFVTMTAGERRIDLHPMEFGPSGDGSASIFRNVGTAPASRAFSSGTAGPSEGSRSFPFRSSMRRIDCGSTRKPCLG